MLTEDKASRIISFRSLGRSMGIQANNHWRVGEELDLYETQPDQIDHWKITCKLKKLSPNVRINKGEVIAGYEPSNQLQRVNRTERAVGGEQTLKCT